MGKNLNLRANIALGLIFAFLVNTLGPIPTAQADEFRLPAPGVMVPLSPVFNPPILKGIKVYPDNPFRFDFILDQGDSPSLVKEGVRGSLKQESTKLIKYFLASLTIPEKDLWVNLSPYEKNRIVPQSFGQTEMGRDLLAEDYMLKQITASLIYPEGETGKKFWKRIYEKAAQRFGTTDIPVNTFNKVWIVPEKAVVYENPKAGTAYVVESKLKVMLEQDYLALEKNSVIQKNHVILSAAKDLNRINLLRDSSATPQNDVNTLGSQIVREIVIPELTKEVNEDKNFSQLRQVYNSLILATWYKEKIKDSILAQVYADKNKIKGLSSPHALIGDPEHIYQQYLKAFKKGVYNYIKEEQDPLTEQMIPRKYFSGGFNLDMAMGSNGPLRVSVNPDVAAMAASKGDFLIKANLVPDRAMSFTGIANDDVPPNREASNVVNIDSYLWDRFPDSGRSAIEPLGLTKTNFVNDNFVVPTENTERGTKEHVYPQLRINKLHNRILKGTIDFILATIGMVFTLPIMLLIAAAIYIDDRGPIFYISDRVGLHGKIFKMYKYRTMRADAESMLQDLIDRKIIDPVSYEMIDKKMKDPRLTRIGDFLRRSKLDELPQFFNVINGTMSLSGPRAMTKKAESDDSKLYNNRHAVKPAIFGLAQNRDGSSKRRGKYDKLFVENWSWGLEWLILKETIYNLIHGKADKGNAVFKPRKATTKGNRLFLTDQIVTIATLIASSIMSGAMSFWGDNSGGKPKSDKAMGSQIDNMKSLNSIRAPGGIDLTPANMNVEVKAGELIKFHLDPAMLQQLQNAPGFTPVIINIQPMTDLPLFLGIDSGKAEPSLARSF